MELATLVRHTSGNDQLRGYSDSWSWLFHEHDREFIHQSNPPLTAAISIDPQWALAETCKFFETELATQPSRKLTTVFGLTYRLVEMLDELESN